MTKDIRADPSTYGQKWIDIHSLAASIETHDDIVHILKSILIIIDNIKCGKCHRHAHEYLKEHSFDKYYSLTDPQGRLVGIFIYFVEFHNIVNQRLGKPELSHQEALNMYYSEDEDTGFCTMECGH